VNLSSEPSATPAPVYVVPAEPPHAAMPDVAQNEDGTRPRRSGWWSRKVLGKN
jgi:hypothetical protein